MRLAVAMALVWSVWAAHAPDAQTPEVETDSSLNGKKAYQARDFDRQSPALEGKDWRIEKAQDDAGRWEAQLYAGGEHIETFGGAGRQPEMVGFLLWQRVEGGPLLFVLRYAGGSDGYERISVVRPEGAPKVLYETDDAYNFSRIEDLNADGWPEVVGFSRTFADWPGLSPMERPFPTVVLGYAPKIDAYRCQNKEFAAEGTAVAERFRSVFDLNRPINANVAYDPEDAQAMQRQFGPFLRLIVELYYLGSEKEAQRLMREYLAKDDRDTVRTLLKERIENDKYYQEMAGS